tara:strand:+ start:2936 stop:4222 length:1287 start_codon:yes stop_codon:yes gene_type:complete
MKKLYKIDENVILQNGIIYDPFENKKYKSDIYIKNGLIKKIEENIKSNDGLIIDCNNKIITTGFVDIHAHFREPGQENKETIKTGSISAMAGGFTDVCIMPNTSPPIDSPEAIRFVLDKAAALPINIHPIGAITRSQLGKEISEIGGMVKNGAVAISDDGLPVVNGNVLRFALEYSKMFDIPVINHAEDVCLRANGMINEGYISTILGLDGNPDISESTMIYRDLSIAEYVGGKIHIPHVSSAKSVDIIKEFKDRGVNVTAEVTPHHLFANEEILLNYNSNAKVAPPIRTENDRLALVKGLQSGVIDCIATDHAPHAIEDKECDFEQACCGTIGLETAFSLSYEALVKNGSSIEDLIRWFTLNPSKIVGIKKHGIVVDKMADICIIDIEKEWTLSNKDIYSKSDNTPFIGTKFSTFVDSVISKGYFFK